MIMDILIELILTTVRRSGNQILRRTFKLKLFFSGPNTNEPCIFPFRFFFKDYDKCATIKKEEQSGSFVDIEVNLQKQVFRFRCLLNDEKA